MLVNRILLLGSLAAVLSVSLPGQELAAPAPLLVGRVFPMTAAPQAASDEITWKSSLNLGATYASGNTSLRTANLAADGSRKQGLHRTSATVSWIYSEQKDSATKQWSLDQRRTTGGARHQKFFTTAERSYTFVAVDAENNHNQNVDLRLTATIGVGNQFIKEKGLKVSFEIGGGYFSEASRTPGAADSDFITGRAGWVIDWQVTDRFQVLNDLKFFFSLEDDREMYGQVDTKLRATLGDRMFAQAQWLLQWDNTPSRDANGSRNHSIDHLLLLSIGWLF